MVTIELCEKLAKQPFDVYCDDQLHDYTRHDGILKILLLDNKKHTLYLKTGRKVSQKITVENNDYYYAMYQFAYWKLTNWLIISLCLMPMFMIRDNWWQLAIKLVCISVLLYHNGISIGFVKFNGHHLLK